MVSGAKVKAALVLLAVFLLGAVAGAGGAHALGKRRMAELVSGDREELRMHRRMRALERALDLTDEQARRVRAAFEKHREAHRDAMDAMFRDCGEPLADVREALDAEIREILTPEQQKRFEEIRERRGKRFFGRGHRRHRRDPGRPPGRAPPP